MIHKITSEVMSKMTRQEYLKYLWELHDETERELKSIKRTIDDFHKDGVEK